MNNISIIPHAQEAYEASWSKVKDVDVDSWLTKTAEAIQDATIKGHFATWVEGMELFEAIKLCTLLEERGYQTRLNPMQVPLRVEDGKPTYGYTLSINWKQMPDNTREARL